VVQTILFFAAPPTDTSLFWGWNTLLAFIGAVAGHYVGFKPLFVFANVYSYLYFITSVAALVGAQVLYAKFPPISTVPAGQAGLGVSLTFLLNVLIIFCIWYGVSREHLHRTNWKFFGRWLVLTAFLTLLMFLGLTDLDEVWVAYISGGVVVFLSVFFHLILLGVHDRRRLIKG